MSGYIAHINSNGNCQSVEEHCKKVAEYAEQIMEETGFPAMGRIAGLLHDAGKGERFTEYIVKAQKGEKVLRGSVNHTFAPVILIWERYHKGEDKCRLLAAEILACAVGSHHGLFDCCEIEGESGFEKRLNKNRNELEYEKVKAYFEKRIAVWEDLDRLFDQAVEELRNNAAFWEDKFNIAMLTRMLTSALIQADRLDTKEFMQEKKEVLLCADADFWEENLEFLERKLGKDTQNRQEKVDKKIQTVRQNISDRCRERAGEGDGVYQLNVPTGAGKTLASMRYAYATAMSNRKKRVIFLTPLLSVLEQNSKEICRYTLHKEAILEHHSNVVRDAEQAEELAMYELAEETWNMPIVVSTLVQFLLILGDGKTSSIRRMQALCDSVIVIDEIQSLPWKLTAIFNQAINFLTQLCHATVILCSATQPCLGEMKPSLCFAKHSNLVTVTDEMREAFKRTKIVDRTRPEGYQTEEVAEFAMEQLERVNSVLVICNTKRTAREVYQYAKCASCTVLHLSNAMCMKHRQNVMNQLEDILERQKKGSQEKVLCISTQILEAGIDISMACVIRAKAGLDNVIQSAGRVNRHSEYGEIKEVYIVNINDENIQYLQEIEKRQDALGKFLTTFHGNPQLYDGELDSEKSVEMYYRILYRELENKKTLRYPVKGHMLYDLLKYGVNIPREQQIMKQPFKKVGMEFSVFDERGEDVLVPYQEGKEIIEEILSEKARNNPEYLQTQLRRASAYTISIFEGEWNNPKDYIQEYIVGNGRILLLKDGYYDEETGFCKKNTMDLLSL